MVRLMIAAGFALVLIPAMAMAGAWPRAEGEGFLSFSVDTDVEDASNNFVSFYVEYGLSSDRTLGVERRENAYEINKTVVFVRWPVRSFQGSTRLAYELGVGVSDAHAVLRPGVSVGHGFEFGKRSGWISLDSRALIYDDLDRHLFEAEFTVGLQATPRTKLILQLQGGAPSDQDAYAKFAPSLVIQQAEGRHFTIGVTAGIHEVDDVKLNLGLWQEF